MKPAAVFLPVYLLHSTAGTVGGGVCTDRTGYSIPTCLPTYLVPTGLHKIYLYRHSRNSHRRPSRAASSSCQDSSVFYLLYNQPTDRSMAPTNTASVSASSSTWTSSSGQDKKPHVSANFAQKKSADHAPVEYDHEIYLQLMAGGSRAEKTPNQVYREVGSTVCLVAGSALVWNRLTN